MIQKSPDPVDKHIGGRIRMRRLQLGISQEKLGEALGLTFQQVQKYEKGTNRVGGSRMAQLARILDVEIGFFYLGAPGHDAATGATSSLLDDFMASKDGLMIAEAFVAISDPQIRHIIATAISSLSKQLTPSARTLMAAE